MEPSNEPVLSDRMRQLLKLLERQPREPFLLYGLAMEFKKAGSHERAIAAFDDVISVDPGYCYAYYQSGLVHESTGDVEAAKRSYRRGIEEAIKKGDAHAKSELEAALSLIE